MVAAKLTATQWGEFFFQVEFMFVCLFKVRIAPLPHESNPYLQKVEFIFIFSKASVSSCHRCEPKTVPAQTAEITKCHLIVLFSLSLSGVRKDVQVRG